MKSLNLFLLLCSIVFLSMLSLGIFNVSEKSDESLQPPNQSNKKPRNTAEVEIETSIPVISKKRLLQQKDSSKGKKDLQTRQEPVVKKEDPEDSLKLLLEAEEYWKRNGILGFQNFEKLDEEKSKKEEFLDLLNLNAKRSFQMIMATKKMENLSEQKQRTLEEIGDKISKDFENMLTEFELGTLDRIQVTQKMCRERIVYLRSILKSLSSEERKEFMNFYRSYR